MQIPRYSWFNGKIRKTKEIKVSIFSHTLHYGSGVFEGIRFYLTKNGSAVFKLDEHIDRLYNSARVLRMKIPYSKQEIKKAIFQVIKKNNFKAGYIRPIIFYGEGKMGLNPVGAKVETAVLAWPWGKYLKESVKVKISKIIRIHPRSVFPEAKVSGYYVNSIFASFDVVDKKFDEAILLDYQGYIAEGPGENIFIVKNGKLYTPKAGSILPGITRKAIIEIAKTLKIPVKEKIISLKELLGCDEAFFTGTAVEVTPISQINERKKKIGPITSIIRKEFQSAVKGEKYKNWLTYL